MPYSSHLKETPTSDPHLVLEEFFDIIYHLSEAIEHLHKMVRSAFAHKSRLTKKDILDLLYFKEQLSKLLEAASLLASDNKKHKKDCVQMQHNTGEWNYFPRHLSLEEFTNPYLVLEKCFNKKEAHKWASLLEELFHAAAYDGFFTTPPQDKDIYNSCHRLFAIVEACAIIYEHRAGASTNNLIQL